jgi:prolyl oligopeptidase
MLARIPQRDEIKTRITALTGEDISIKNVTRARNRYFYYKRAPGWDNYKLVSYESKNERTLYDPEAAAKSGEPHQSIDFFVPSRSGNLVIAGVSPGGSEDSLIYVIDARDGRVVEGPIDRAQWADPSWLDERSFVYTRRQVLTPSMPASARYEKRRAYLHRLNTPPTTDVALAGIDVPGSPPLGIFDDPSVLSAPNVPYLFLTVGHGAKSEHAFYMAPLTSRISSTPKWQLICDATANVIKVVAHGQSLYLLSHQHSSRYEVLRTALAHPDVAHAEVVVAPARGVVTAMRAASDGLYVVERDGAVDRLLRLPWSGGPARELALPFAGALVDHASEPDRRGVIFSLNGWIQPPTSYANDGNATTKLPFSPASRVDVSELQADEVTATSVDGTAIPLSIVHRRDLPLDGNNPTLLNGYGAYGIAMEASFRAEVVAWLEHGGVFAMAHARGGGELGEAWHLAGYKTTKQRTIDDFIACAEYLIAKHWTRPARLAGQGTSAGGITIAGAITQRPDLFGAALIRVGDSDILRAEFGTDGQGNAEEYGTVKIREQFEAMYKVSGYQRVKNGVKYPAVLLTGGFNDPRVAIFQSSKMTARLQAATASGKPVLLRVEFDAGHGMGSTKLQRDLQTADEYAFLLWQLGVPDFQPRQ